MFVEYFAFYKAIRVEFVFFVICFFESKYTTLYTLHWVSLHLGTFALCQTMSSTSAIISLVFVQNYIYIDWPSISQAQTRPSNYIYINFEMILSMFKFLVIAFQHINKYFCTASETGIQHVFLLLGHSRLRLISKRNNVKNTETEMVAKESFSSETDLIIPFLYKLWRSTKKAHACLVAEIRTSKKV